MSALVCATCGGRMQASAKLYLEISADGTLYTHGLNTEEVSYYCENDHPAPPDLVASIEGAVGGQFGSLRDLMESGL